MNRNEMMGRVVRVNMELDGQTRRIKSALIRTITRRGIAHRAGWVVGFSWVCEGLVQFDSYVDQRQLDETSRIPCVLVTYWPNMRPVRVPLDGYTYPTDLKPESPSKRDWRIAEERDPDQVRKCKQQMAEYATDMPRDSCGRFVKEGE